MAKNFGHSHNGHRGNAICQRYVTDCFKSDNILTAMNSIYESNRNGR
jgi:hypothetical protein